VAAKVGVDFIDHILSVNKSSDEGVVLDVVLEDAVGTVKGTAACCVEGEVIATENASGTRAFFEELAFLTGEEEGGFPPEEFFFDWHGACEVCQFVFCNGKGGEVKFFSDWFPFRGMEFFVHK